MQFDSKCKDRLWVTTPKSDASAKHPASLWGRPAKADALIL